MSLTKLTYSLSESSNLSIISELSDLSTAPLVKLKFETSSLCNNFIDLTAISNESSLDLEIPEIDIDSSVTDESNITIKAYNFFTKKLCINEIRYSPMPIEYPPTSLEGTAIVYNISG
ncbi:19372_t:CDS:2 [Dentiscutata erythropus]|uniref:19372_t:CDS:1 n=1 Tax=Dentiscutata erythropus TaxID=1348616 RepID=A0A9N9DX02_9GLOM|nr:19372_t:CDS:2 [Dentiscutata erythropus]